MVTRRKTKNTDKNAGKTKQKKESTKGKNKNDQSGNKAKKEEKKTGKKKDSKTQKTQESDQTKEQEKEIIKNPSKLKPKQRVNVLGIDYELLESYEDEGEMFKGDLAKGWSVKRENDGKVFYLSNRMIKNWGHQK